MELITCTPADMPARMNEIQWQAMWRHYILPGHIKPSDASFAAGVQVSCWDLDCCVIAVVDGEDVGFCWGCRHEEEAGCAGFGVKPEFRGLGIGQRLLQKVASQLRDRGVRIWRLEVVQQNHGAVRSYLKAGFTRGRDLGLYRGRVEAPLGAGESVVPADPATCLARYATWPQVRRTWGAAPWQLRRRQANYTAAELHREGDVVAFMLYSGTSVVDIGLAPGEHGESGVKLISTLPSFAWGNVPDDDPVRAALDGRPGVVCWVKQWEMEWLL